jgi:hypothetical protein
LNGQKEVKVASVDELKYKKKWLSFVDTYRTFCLAPPEAKEILQGIQQFTPGSALRHCDGTLLAP